MIAAKKLMMVGGGLTDPDARALVARMDVKPSRHRQRLIQALIVDLKTAGVWDRLRHLYVIAAHDAQASRLNWKPNGANIIWSGAVNFQADGGVRDGGGEAVGAYFPFPSTGTSNLCWGVWAGYFFKPTASGSQMFGQASGTGGELSFNNSYYGQPSRNIAAYALCQMIGSGIGMVYDDSLPNGMEEFRGAVARPEGAEICVNDEYYTQTFPSPRTSASGNFGVSSPMVQNRFNGQGMARNRVTWMGQSLTREQSRNFRFALVKYLRAVGVAA